MVLIRFACRWDEWQREGKVRTQGRIATQFLAWVITIWMDNRDGEYSETREGIVSCSDVECSPPFYTHRPSPHCHLFELLYLRELFFIYISDLGS